MIANLTYEIIIFFCGNYENIRRDLLMDEDRKKTHDFWNDSNIKIYNNAMQLLIDRITELDGEYHNKTGRHFIRIIEKRLKTPESIEQKLIYKGKEKSEEPVENLLNDLAGVRIVCFDTSQIYKIISMIKKEDKFEIIKEKDYISKPKTNGYQSYHLILKIENVKVELQIRTILMDAWSSLETILVYKKSNPISEELKKEIHQFDKWSKKMDKLVQKMVKQR